MFSTHQQEAFVGVYNSDEYGILPRLTVFVLAHDEDVVQRWMGLQSKQQEENLVRSSFEDSSKIMFLVVDSSFTSTLRRWFKFQRGEEGNDT